jgi:hypothetical protein
LAVELEDHGSLLERKFGRVRVRKIDQLPAAVGPDVAEPAAVGAGGNVRHDVDCLAFLEERGLERDVVAGRHEQLVWQAAFA